jgi:hypothetical protein
MKKSTVVYNVLFILTALTGCKIVSYSPDAAVSVVLKPGETQEFSIKTDNDKNYNHYWEMTDPDGKTEYYWQNTAEPRTSVKFDAKVDDIGLHKMKYRAEAYAIIGIVPTPYPTPIVITISKLKKEWDVLVKGVKISPSSQSIFPQGKPVNFTAEAYPAGSYSYRWYLDGALCGVQAGYSFTPASDMAGEHSIEVIAVNGSDTFTSSRSFYISDGCIAGSDTLALTAIKSLSDGGYMVAGSSSAKDIPGVVNHGGSDLYAARYDNQFRLLWQGLYGGYENEVAADEIVLTSDGGFIFYGVAEKSDGGWYDFIMKIDGAGKMIWKRDFKPESLDVSPCGGLYYSDIRYNEISKTTESAIVKLNDAGEIVFTRLFDSTYSAKKVYSTPDCGCIATVREEKSGVSLIKYDPVGSVLWERNIPVDWILKVMADDSGSAVVAGTTYFNDIPGVVSHGSVDCYLAKIDSSGAILWQYRYGSANQDKMNRVFAERNNVGFAIVSETGGGSLMVRTDVNGGVKLQKFYEGMSPFLFYHMLDVPDGGMFIANTFFDEVGKIRSKNGVRLVKMNANGEVITSKNVIHQVNGPYTTIYGVAANSLTSEIEILIYDGDRFQILKVDANGNL